MSSSPDRHIQGRRFFFPLLLGPPAFFSDGLPSSGEVREFGATDRQSISAPPILKRLEGATFPSVLDPPEVERDRQGHYRVRLDLELVDETDEPAAIAFMQDFAAALVESVS